MMKIFQDAHFNLKKKKFGENYFEKLLTSRSEDSEFFSVPKTAKTSIFFTAIVLSLSISKALITLPEVPEPIVVSSFHLNRFPLIYSI